MRLSQLTDKKLSADMMVEGITADSRQVKKGFVFAAIPGSKGNGADYIADAVLHGASAVLAQTGIDFPEGEYVRLTSDNPRHDFAQMAAAFYQLQPETVVAVTGTSGKTSVVSFTQQLWHLSGIESCASVGTLGTRGPKLRKYGSLTTPDAAKLQAELADLAAVGITHLAMEASSHGLDQYRLDGVKLKAAAFTNLSRDHLDYHGTMEAYFEAKARLFTDLLPVEGTAVIFLDKDGYGQKLVDICAKRGVKTITVGEKNADITMVDRTLTPGGQDLNLTVKGKDYQVALPLVGSFQAWNALIALGLVMASGAEAEKSVPHLVHLRKVAGRLQPVDGHPDGAGIYIDYAHKPAALEEILKTLRPHTKNRLIAVFGCGGDRDAGKRPIMGKIAHEYADLVIVTDDNPRSEDPLLIRRAILDAAPGAIEIGERAEAIDYAIREAGTGDVVVIAGKGHETGQIVGDQILPFDDEEEARRVVNLMSEKKKA